MMKYITGLILILFIMNNPECYTIETVHELKKRLIENDKTEWDFDDTLKSKAFLYYLSRGEVILLPNDLREDSKGIFFTDYKCYLKCLQEEKFPYAGEKVSTIEKYQLDSENVDLEIKEIVYSLLGIVGDANVEVNMLDHQSLSHLLTRIKNNQHHLNLSEKERYYTCIVLGEYLRLKYSMRWIFLKRYGDFNAYFYPALINDENKVLLFPDYFSSYMDNQTISLSAYSQLEHVKNPSLDLNSKVFANSFYGYDIIE